MYSFKYQIFSTILALIGVYLATQQNFLTWPISMISCFIAFFIYIDKALYAKCVFMIFAIVNSFYGWYLWMYGGPNNEGIYVTRSSTNFLIFMFIIGLISTFAFGEILKKYTNSEIAYWDSFYASFGIIAHWMLANKKIETWIIWIVIDIVFANICLSKGLHILAIKCFLYTLISVYGYLNWRRFCIK
ncbi:MAG: nicotinamide mononucleotide transporter [Bacteroidetes bacterium]|nr:nicotinamide mononucleotide transporter [Bacteroidota bacterium]